MMYRGPDALAAAGVLEACVAEGTVGYGVSIFKNMYDSAGNPRTLPQAVVRDDDLPSYIIMYGRYSPASSPTKPQSTGL